jgi:hypothetical protein
MRRRTFLGLTGTFIMARRKLVSQVQAQPAGPKTSLLTAPLELAGNWRESPADAVTQVVTRMREACLSGLRLLSDRQPAKLRVENHTEGPPAIWLHNDDAPDMAWIIVNTAPRAWSQLAYQFGHELGHVLCNSWQANAKPSLPSQWLEEALVEAFSMRGIGRLAASWERDPSFDWDSRYATPFRQYRLRLIEQYAKATDMAAGRDFEAWFRAYRPMLERGEPLPEGRPAVLSVLTLLESDPACVEDLGAVNRWPARTGLPIEQYLDAWMKSCSEIRAAGSLPVRLRNLLHLS